VNAKGPVPEGDLVALRPGLPVPTRVPVLLDGASPTVASVNAAACAPSVAGVVFDSLVEDPAVLHAVGAARRGTIVCPGVTTPATESTVTYPDHVTSGEAVSFQLGCVRDCLYVATLLGADRRPVVAGRGELRGGAPAATVTLPRSTLGQPSYSLDVRLVSRVNPGDATRLASPVLPRT
jgi:hypothetical protein